MYSSGTVAKVALLSSMITIILVGGLVVALRQPMLTWLQEEMVMPAVQKQVATVHDTADQITETVAQSLPAVVSIVVTKDVPIYEQYYEEYNPFGGFFGGFAVPRIRENGTEQREVGGGSGFVVSDDGLIVTNRHVVSDDEATYSAVLSDGTSVPVTVIARDTYLDIAIVQFESMPADITPLQFGDSDTIQLGQSVIAIGNALAEFQNSVSTGVVSGLSRSIVAGDGFGMREQLEEVIQTDAAINLGNSGGPLLDVSGRVIGVNVAASAGAENIGFAIPSNLVERVVTTVAETGRIVRPFLGVRYVTVTPQLAVENELAVEYGALVVSGSTRTDVAVLPDSPADQAGIREGDILLAINDQSLREVSLAQALRSARVGDRITVTLLRDGGEETLSVILTEAPQ